MNFTIGGVLFIIPVYVQGVLGADPLTTGLTLIPMSVAIFIMSSAAGQTINKNSTTLYSCHWVLNGFHGWKYLFKLDFHPVYNHIGYGSRDIPSWYGYGNCLSPLSQRYILSCQIRSTTRCIGYNEYWYKSRFITWNSCFRRNINHR
jgi:hypothetical protein